MTQLTPAELAEHDPGAGDAARRAAAVPPVPGPIRVAGGGEIRVGTASWTDPTMTAAGVFYPPEANNAEERLRYYASQFPIVEVDASYYAIPAAETARLWVDRTPPGFVLDIKAHALMTGQPSEVKRLPKAIRESLPEEQAAKARIYGKDLPAELYDEVWASFGRAIEPLKEAGKLGAVFLQFPRWVFPSNENRELLLDARRRLGVEVAAEFRNASWFNEKNAERTLKFLEENKIPYVMVDGPQGLKSSIPPLTAVTSPELAVIRFHGRRTDLWEKPDIPVVERFRYLYDEDQLADWVPRIRQVARAVKQTHVLLNNCFSNYGTTNARELADLLREQLGD
ncbi:MAG: DUF72 domain-containing protein [Candidatus Dormibacteraeota bacterium]|nr:DUF72 domain-containing protein [Candidatus Dormibacteraeota bacterium]